MVAQILGRGPVSPISNPALPALAGNVSWREFSVPVCRSSQLLGYDEAADRDYERVVVLWPMKSSHSRAFLGLTSLTAPRVLDVGEGSVPNDAPELSFALDYLMVDGQLGVIPDIERLSGLLYPPGI